MKTKLFTIAMMVAFIMTAMTKVQAQNFEGPCLPSEHGLDGHQSAFCGSTETQTIALSAGVNWVSFYIESETILEDLKESLQTALGNANGNITAQTGGYAKWNGHTWRGNLQELDLSQMFLIEVSTGCEISLEGMPIDPAGHPANIVAGQNWIGYPLNTEMTVINAFAGFASNGDKLTSQGNGYTQYNNNWRGALRTLVPGQGYMYTSPTGGRTLVFPTTAK